MSAVNPFPGNSDPDDQSISDEEEQPHCTWPENFVSLAGTSDRKKESTGVASQLELLKAVHQNVDFSSDDEVEVPDFDEKRNHDSRSTAVGHSISLKGDGSTYEVDEQLSSDESKESKMIVKYAITRPTVSETLDLYARGKQKQFESCAWSAVDKNARRPVDRYPTGGRPTAKTRLPSHHQHKKGTFWPSVEECEEHVSNSTSDDSPDEPEAIDFQAMNKYVSEFVGCSDGKQISESIIDIQQHDRSQYRKKGSRKKGRVGKNTVIRSASPSGNDTVSDEDPCKVMHTGLLKDNEDKVQNQELAVLEIGTRTMADKFHEAFGSSVNDRRPSFAVVNQSSNGLFARLQKVLQSQKESDTEFLRKLQTDVWPRGEASCCLDVKILSRSYDAKLSVCQCSLLENEESSLKNPHLENFGKIWTVIFNSRVCDTVDLEAASLVRIHPPWKEVPVIVSGEIMILATYYSQIYT